MIKQMGMHIENVPMHIEEDWHQHFYQKLINLTQGSHTKNQHGGTRLGGIQPAYLLVSWLSALVGLQLSASVTAAIRAFLCTT